MNMWRRVDFDFGRGKRLLSLVLGYNGDLKEGANLRNV